MDEFCGRLYVYIPCYIKNDKGRQVLAGYDASDAYVEAVSSRFSDEISNRNLARFSRGQVGTFPFDFFGLHENDDNCELLEGKVYFSLNEKTKLCIMTVLFVLNGEPVTQFLDRVSREKIKIRLPSGERKELYSYLRERMSIFIAGKARVCLSTGRKIPEAIKPSIFANEMYDSDVMYSAQLQPGFDAAAWRQNIAVYNSSEIYASKHTVVRYDPSLDGEDPELCGGSVKAVERDLMLTFIIEILMFREASIKKVNLSIFNSIQSEVKLSLSDIDSLMKEFRSAILFWDLDIFLYPSAQSISDKLFNRFDIDRSLEIYQKNQAYLQQRVGVSNAIQSEREVMAINAIAILVFFFEVTPFVYSIIGNYMSNGGISMTELLTAAGSLTTSLMLFLSIVAYVRIRKGRP